MKNRLIIILISFLLSKLALAESLQISSKNISIDKNKQSTVFEKDVIILTEKNNKIKSNYAEYNKEKGLIKLKDNIEVIDIKGNTIKTNHAEYFEKSKIFKSFGPTEVKTSDDYIINGEDIVFDDSKKFIKSEKDTIITDSDKNKIFLNSFEYQINKNIFKSIGYIKIKDKMNNEYEFSQIYIDTKKKEILGTDIKAFMNDETLKVNKKNKPRIFANTIKLNKNDKIFNKSIFTICDYRENDKCPPWTIQASKILHDNKRKTIYYDNALIKVYDIPIFYLPKLSHPDPSVNRRSGFLPPAFSDTKNLGAGISIPYFWAINDDKNFTITNRVFVDEHPLVIAEYHQAFKNSKFLTDFGYTKGYKNTSEKKKAGSKSHIFTRFVKSFNDKNSENTLSVSLQEVSDDKYLKLYKIKSDLVDYSTSTLVNSVDFTKDDENIFLGFNASIYETLKDEYNDKYEYILPEITINKELFSNEKLGIVDFQTNLKVHKYDTNKSTHFLINDFDLSSNDIYHDIGLKSKFLGNIKNINYETKNVALFKKDTTSEIFGAIGYLSEINFKKKKNDATHLLKPKMLIRYSPGSMRKETEGSKLDPVGAFSMDRLNNSNNFETGLSTTIGFDYKVKQYNRELDFSVAQIINEKENKKMASKTSLDEKISDLVGSTKYKLNENVSLNYNFSLDQNYNQLNYNEFGAILDLNPIKVNFNYLKESEHIGNQEYFNTKINLANNESGLLSFETKRNLITSSSEFYNLSYEYVNDCLRAGLVYRREFYNDSELEPENSLMFKITLTPFGDVNSPSFIQ